MPKVFGRETDGSHPLDPILEALLGGPIATRAVALNLMHDRRVCEERERSFLKIFDLVRNDPGNTSMGAEAHFKLALATYRNEFLSGHAIRDPHRVDDGSCKPVPHFAVRDQNENNLLDGNRYPRPVPGTMLTNVLDLTGLAQVYRFAHEHSRTDPEWRRIFRNYPTRSGPDALAEWLDRYLREGTSAAERQSTFVRATFQALNRCRDQFGPFQPLWATRWEKFRERTAEAGPEAWLEATGLGREDPRRWLIVLVYPVEKVHWLARPTQLDAGWYHYHFPSPPFLDADLGGHPMDLRTKPCPKQLLPEFIHEQFEYDYLDWDDPQRRDDPQRNRLVGCTSGPSVDALELQRRNHHRLLIASYPEKNGVKIEDWMPEPF